MKIFCAFLQEEVNLHCNKLLNIAFHYDSMADFANSTVDFEDFTLKTPEGKKDKETLLPSVIGKQNKDIVLPSMIMEENGNTILPSTIIQKEVKNDG